MSERAKQLLSVAATNANVLRCLMEDLCQELATEIGHSETKNTFHQSSNINRIRQDINRMYSATKEAIDAYYVKEKINMW